MKYYNCYITSNSTLMSVYNVTTSSAMKCAKELGRRESGETVTVSTYSGKVVSKVKWFPEDGGRYIRVTI